MEELQNLIDTLARKSGGGGVDTLETLAALRPEQYDALVNLLRAFGVLGDNPQSPPSVETAPLPKEPLTPAGGTGGGRQ